MLIQPHLHYALQNEKSFLCDPFSIAAVQSSDYCALGEILSVEQIMEEG